MPEGLISSLAGSLAGTVMPKGFADSFAGSIAGTAMPEGLADSAAATLAAAAVPTGLISSLAGSIAGTVMPKGLGEFLAGTVMPKGFADSFADSFAGSFASAAMPEGLIGSFAKAAVMQFTNAAAMPPISTGLIADTYLSQVNDALQVIRDADAATEVEPKQKLSNREFAAWLTVISFLAVYISYGVLIAHNSLAAEISSKGGPMPWDAGMAVGTLVFWAWMNHSGKSDV